MVNKILISLMLLIFTGCGYESMNNYNTHIIITDVGKSFYSEKNNDNMCYYIGNSGSTIAGLGELYSSDNFCFYDTCGKFQIGDTINFIKK